MEINFLNTTAKLIKTKQYLKYNFGNISYQSKFKPITVSYWRIKTIKKPITKLFGRPIRNNNNLHAYSHAKVELLFTPTHVYKPLDQLHG